MGVAIYFGAAVLFAALLPYGLALNRANARRRELNHTREGAMTLVLHCTACGLQSPQNCPLTDDVKDARQVSLEMECFHCGRSVTTVITAGEIRLASESDEPLER